MAMYKLGRLIKKYSTELLLSLAVVVLIFAMTTFSLTSVFSNAVDSTSEVTNLLKIKYGATSVTYPLPYNTSPISTNVVISDVEMIINGNVVTCTLTIADTYGSATCPPD